MMMHCQSTEHIEESVLNSLYDMGPHKCSGHRLKTRLDLTLKRFTVIKLLLLIRILHLISKADLD